jgi:hypothetical protein
MAQFQVADVPGAAARGQQFKHQAEIRPLEIAAAQQALIGQQNQQQQQGQFSALRNQGLQQQIDQRTDQQKNQSLFNAALRVSTASDDQIIPILEAQIAMVNRLGGDPEQAMNALQLARQGDFDTIRSRANNLIEIGVRQGDIKAPAGQQQQSAEGITFESLIANFSPADKTKARRVKAGLDPRMIGSATQTIADLGTSATIADVEKVISSAKEAGKLTAQQKLKPAVEAAVIAAVGQAKAEVAKLGEERSSIKTLAIYNNSMSNLTKALDNTITGPFIGLTPALTANAQIADGAIAMMLPLMKDVFRGAGEGTFTEGDQKILTDMIPTRSDSAEARRTKIMFIDELIRARLTTAPVAEAQQSGLSEAEQSELQQLRAEFGGQ